MRDFTRREMIKAAAVSLAGAAFAPAGAATGTAPASAPPRADSIPLLHVTDLYHPPQDPDDQIDLATVFALPEFDLRGVVLDATQTFLTPAPAGWDVARDPGFVPVAQLAFLTGRSVPVAAGPTAPLRDAHDDARDRSVAEQAGIALLLAQLESSAARVVISLTGSARVLTAAFNRAPELVRAKTRFVLLNAGATGGAKREWNVMLDPAAFVGLWRSGLPIHWYPCATEKSAFDPAPERGTFWRATHAELFRDLPAPLASWFAYALAGSGRGDIIRAVRDGAHGAALWDRALGGPRNLWATASLVMAAGRVLARTAAGWRFVANPAARLETWPMRLDPITATAADDGSVIWQESTEPATAHLFGRQGGADYGKAMAEALNALLRGLAV